MTDVSGFYFIDGIDLWTAFGLMIEEGSADFLRYPPKKVSIEHDWMDSNGIDVDLSRVFFGPREGVLNCAIFAESEDDFWTKHNQFIATMTQPNLRRLSIKAHGERSYNVYYKECNNYKQIKALKGLDTAYKIVGRFSLVIVEPEPTIDASNVFIVDEDGRFLIT
jgi:hypothetical protein